MRIINTAFNFFGKIFPFNSKYWKFFWNNLNEGWIRLHKLILVLIIISDFIILFGGGFEWYHPSDGNFIIYLFFLAVIISLLYVFVCIVICNYDNNCNLD